MNTTSQLNQNKLNKTMKNLNLYACEFCCMHGSRSAISTHEKICIKNPSVR